MREKIAEIIKEAYKLPHDSALADQILALIREEMPPKEELLHDDCKCECCLLDTGGNIVIDQVNEILK